MPGLSKLAEELGKKAYFFAFSNWGYDTIGFLLIASRDSLAQKPDEARRFAPPFPLGGDAW
jgi:hypothetical protein